MKVGFRTSPQNVDWATLEAAWVEAGQHEIFDSGWMNDHLGLPGADRGGASFEPLTALAALAHHVPDKLIGQTVLSGTFRHPAIVAREALTLDHITSGRYVLGIGAGWHPWEHEAFGIELPPLKKRFELLAETFEILHGLMTEEVFAFEGRHRTITSARFEPKPVQRPRPPFVVGGAGPRRTIPLAARWADQWNYPDFTGDMAAFASALARLHEACEEIGRDPTGIEVSAQFRYPNDPGETAERVAAFRESGAHHVLISFMPPTGPDLPSRVAETLGA